MATFAEEVPTYQKIARATKWMGSRSLEWAGGIRMLWLTLITERNGFFLGPPGAGKSQVNRDLLRCLEGYQLYVKQLSPDMSAKEAMGIYLDVQAYLNDKTYKYITSKSMVMRRGISWLGEIWLGNGSALNAMLGIANEGIIRLGDVEYNTNTILIGDSNDMPDVVNVAEGDVKRKTLVALADRFLLRERIRPHVQSHTSRMSMAHMEADRTRLAEPPVIIPETEIAALTAKARKMITNPKSFPEPIVLKFFKIIEALRKNGIQISDRRWMWAREVLGASAVLDNRDVINETDLKTCRWWGWLTPSHISIVSDVLTEQIKLAYPKATTELTSCGKTFQDLMDWHTENPTVDKVVRIGRGNTDSQKMSDSIRKLESLCRKFPDEADEILPMIDAIKDWNREINVKILGTIPDVQEAV